MILLQINENLQIGGISITDWIQSVGAVVAIIAAIVGFIQLFRKSNEAQQQINDLTTLAQQSEIQSQQLTAQVEQMIEGNKLQEKHIMLLEKSIEISESDSELIKEQRRLEEQRRSFDIRPRIEKDGAAGTKEEMHHYFRNKGGTATIIKAEKLESDSCSFNIDSLSNKELPKNASFTILFKAPPGLKLSQCHVNLRITYKDIDKKEYYQIIEGNPDGKVIANKLTEKE